MEDGSSQICSTSCFTSENCQINKTSTEAESSKADEENEAGNGFSIFSAKGNLMKKPKNKKKKGKRV